MNRILRTFVACLLALALLGIASAVAEQTDFTIISAISALSGGNAQKVIIARELSNDPEVLLASQPTRGVDIGATEFIHRSILALRDQGKAVFLISSELSEVKSLADRIIVIHDGRIVGEFDAESVSFNELGLYMSGAKEMKQLAGEGGNA